MAGEVFFGVSMSLAGFGAPASMKAVPDTPEASADPHRRSAPRPIRAARTLSWAPHCAPEGPSTAIASGSAGGATVRRFAMTTWMFGTSRVAS